MRREYKISLFFIAALAILIFGYKFLTGNSAFSSNLTITAVYDDVYNLQISNPVLKNGFNVGSVTDVYLSPNDPNKAIIELSIRSDIKAPKDLVATITTSGMLGDKAVILNYTKLCSGADCLEDGDVVKGVSKGMLESMVSKSDLDEYINVVNSGVGALIDTLNNSTTQDSGIGKTMKDLEITMENMKQLTGRFDQLMSASARNLQGTIANFEAISGNLKENNAAINGILDNTKTFTASLSELTLDETLATADGTMKKLSATLETTDQTMQDLKTTISKINSGEGSLGQLINSDELYQKIDKASANMNFLLQDLRLHPERYRRILSKKEMPYEVPEKDPAFQ